MFSLFMKASAMTTKMVVVSFIAIIKQWRYYNHTCFKIVIFKFIAKENNSKKHIWVAYPGDSGSAWPPLQILHWLSYMYIFFFHNCILISTVRTVLWLLLKWFTCDSESNSISSLQLSKLCVEKIFPSPLDKSLTSDL